MIKKLLKDNAAMIIPAEMVICFAVIACVASLGWAIGRDPSKMDVVQNTSGDTNIDSQADIAVGTSGEGAVAYSPDVHRNESRNIAPPVADEPETDKRVLSNINICGREDRGFTFYAD
jgi:hypothetical protein